MAHPNEALVRKGYTAFLGGEFAALDELFDEDIVWHAPGRNQLSGDYKGKDAVLGQFAKVFELTGGTFKVDIHAILADDEHAVVLIRATGERPDGRKLDDIGAQVFHIKDGKVTEQWLHVNDPYSGDDFWND